VKTGKSTNETLALLTLTFDEYTTKKLSVFYSCRRFEEGQPKTQGTENELGGEDLNSGLTSGFSTMTIPLHMMC
jgi:hypothetical protein